MARPDFVLPPEPGGPRALNITLADRQHAYVRAWFDDLAEGGDTLDLFLHRFIVELALDYRANKILSEDIDEGNNAVHNALAAEKSGQLP